MDTLSPARRPAALVVAILGTAAMLATLVEPATAAARPAPTTATVSWKEPVIKVKVSSPRASCEGGRHVFALFVTDSFNGAAHGATSERGVYRIGGQEAPQEDGRLMAYVGREKGCRPAQSRTIKLEGQLPSRAAKRARTSAELTAAGSRVRVEVTSPKAACVGARRVALFVYQSNEPFAQAITGRTNRKGVFTSSLVSSGKVVAFVKQTKRCAVGQSNTRRTSPS